MAEVSEDLETKYVRDFYSKHSDEFSSTRYSGWSSVVEFIKSLDTGSYVLDAGKNRHNMDTLSDIHLGHKTISFKEIVIDIVINYMSYFFVYTKFSKLLFLN